MLAVSSVRLNPLAVYLVKYCRGSFKHCAVFLEFHLRMVANPQFDSHLSFEQMFEGLTTIALALQSPKTCADRLTTIALVTQRCLQSDRVLITQVRNHHRLVIAESVGEGWASLREQALAMPTAFAQSELVIPIPQATVSGSVLTEADPTCLYPVSPPLATTESWGFLEIHHCEKTHCWQPREVQFAQQVVGQIAIALQLPDATRSPVEHNPPALPTTPPPTTRLTEEDFERHLANIPGAVYRCQCDPDWTMLYLSDWVEELSGYAASDFMQDQRTWTSIIHPDDRQQVEQGVLMGVAARQPFTLEYRIVHRDGTVRWVYERGRGVFSQRGELLHLDGAIFDIGDRKQAEAALKALNEELELRVQERTAQLQQVVQRLEDEIEDHILVEAALVTSETRLQHLAANVPGMIYQFRLGADGAMNFPYVSSGCYALYEIAPEAVKQDAMLLLNAVHPDDRQAFHTAITQSATTLQPWQWQGRIVTPTGVKWVEGVSKPERKLDGSTLWDGLLIDITDRKLTENALRQTQQFVESILTALPVAVIAKEAEELRYALVNPAASRVLHRQPDELLGKRDRDLFPLAQANYFTQLDRAALGGEIIDLPQEELQLDGETRLLHTKRTVILNPDGAPAYVLVIIEDITERKQAEIALHRSREQLRKHSQALSEFVRSKSHYHTDLQQSLQAILKVAGETLEVSAGVWLLNDDRTELRCVDVYDHKTETHYTGLVDRVADFPIYFMRCSRNGRSCPRRPHRSRMVGVQGDLLCPEWGNGVDGYLHWLQVSWLGCFVWNTQAQCGAGHWRKSVLRDRWRILSVLPWKRGIGGRRGRRCNSPRKCCGW
ncbi:MAG: PAS domain-containing protein [Leptolyngbyaceae cyanobacterium SL_7_1]|nr:PAS domain-containing protein [Leptolyngbyaceae cyanobacterium SL_7_1]